MMKPYKQFFFTLLLFSSVLIHAQEITLHHTGGPNGGLIGDIEVDSRGNLWAGVYSSVFKEEFYRGLYRSTDDGTSWTKIDAEYQHFAEVYEIFLTENDDIFIGTNRQGIYRSTDYGASWSHSWYDSGYTTGECWAITLISNGTLYAGDAEMTGIFASKDYGNTWSKVSSLRPLLFYNYGNRVYAGTLTGLYYSEGNDTLWNKDSTFSNYPVNSIIEDTSGNLYASTGYLPYVGGIGVFFSDDSGRSWVNIGHSDKCVTSLALDSEEQLYAGTYNNGIFMTPDRGTVWYDISFGFDKFNNRPVNKVIITDNNEIYIASENAGIYKYFEHEGKFIQIGLPISRVNNMEFEGDSVIYTSTSSGVQKYNRNTKLWSNLGLNYTHDIDIAPDGKIWAGGTDGVFYSTDRGFNWQPTSFNSDSGTVYNVEVLNNGNIFINTSYKFRLSTDNGSSWQLIDYYGGYFGNMIFETANGDIFFSRFFKTNESFNAFDTSITNFDFAVNDGYTIFNKDTIIVSDVQGGLRLFFSDNGGTDWEIANDSGKALYSLEKFGNHLIGTDLTGDFYFFPEIRSKPAITSMSDTIARFIDLEVDESGTLWGGNIHSGLYKIDFVVSLKGDDMHILVSDFYLENNYPNPFNPSTQIAYSIAEKTRVTIRVFDILGREVEILVDEFRQPGRYSVEFDGTELSSGIYFYTINAGDFRDTKKMILMK